jgi:thiamine-phosphate pyrophosphorylase
VTDSLLIGDRSLSEVVAAATEGGVKVIQYRDKKATTRQMVERASKLAQICHQSGAYLLINDRLDVALAVDADGVHVGQDDMPASLARKLLGPEKLLGVTVHNEEEMRRAEAEGADHLSVAPVFATSTKPDHQTPLGIEGVKTLVRATGLPVVAIGGINSSNASEVVRTGVEGICVVSAVMAAPDPKKAAQELCQIAKEAKSRL